MSTVALMLIHGVLCVWSHIFMHFTFTAIFSLDLHPYHPQAAIMTPRTHTHTHRQSVSLTVLYLSDSLVWRPSGLCLGFFSSKTFSLDLSYPCPCPCVFLSVSVSVSTPVSVSLSLPLCLSICLSVCLSNFGG